LSTPIEALSDTCRAMMLYIRQRGGATISELAVHVGISDEGARQHLLRLERKGWVARRPYRTSGGRSGRPAAIYEISDTGEAFFPKRYDELSVALVDVVGDLYGPQAVEGVLARVTDARVREWEPRLRGKSMDERLALLKNYYLEGDPFTSIERDGHVSLVERNCPFRNVAMDRPALCSITVNTLARLLGCRVERVRKFQRGEGCCEFRVMTDQPIDPQSLRFTLEAEDENPRENS
jgi:predicted ArsR family transcriptional regulator